MATDVIEAARLRLASLKDEVVQLEAFIAMGERIVAGQDIAGADAPSLRPLPTLPRTRTGPSPRQVVRAVHEILKDASHPLDKQAILRALADRGISIVGTNPAKNLGTILWRNQRLFEHVRGHGYRWTGASPDTTKEMEDESGPEAP